LWAICFRNNAQRGGMVEHVYFRDITVSAARLSALSVDFQYDEGATGQYSPVLPNVEVAYMRSASAERVVELHGIPNGIIENVLARNCVFDNVSKGSVIDNTTGVTLSDGELLGAPSVRCPS
jgi:hypothetical protein